MSVFLPPTKVASIEDLGEIVNLFMPNGLKWTFKKSEFEDFEAYKKTVEKINFYKEQHVKNRSSIKDKNKNRKRKQVFKQKGKKPNMDTNSVQKV